MKPIKVGEYPAQEFRLMRLSECTVSANVLDVPERAFTYFVECIETHERFDPDREQLIVVMLNTRRRAIGHVLCASGSTDSVVVSPAQIFREAIVANASAIVLAHNHPSGDPTPSEADIKVTRDLIRAGQLLKIEVLDHVIVGRKVVGIEQPKRWASLRKLGYFYS